MCSRFIIERADSALSRVFPRDGSEIVLLGSTRDEFGGSEYLKTLHGIIRGVPPALDIELERALQSLLVEAASKKWIQSAHDCADGGFAVALAECCFTGGGGADVDVAAVTSSLADPATAALFSESASRVIVSTASGQTAALLARAAALKVPAAVIGRTGGDRIRIRVAGAGVVDCTTAEAEHQWRDGLARYFARQVA